MDDRHTCYNKRVKKKKNSLRSLEQKQEHGPLIKQTEEESGSLLVAPSKLYQPSKLKADSPELKILVLKIPTARFHKKKLNLLLTLWFVYYQYIQMSNRAMSYNYNIAVYYKKEINKTATEIIWWSKKSTMPY